MKLAVFIKQQYCTDHACVLDRLQCRLAFTVACALIAAERIAMLQPHSVSYVELVAYELQLSHAQAALPIFVRIEYSVGR